VTNLLNNILQFFQSPDLTSSSKQVASLETGCDGARMQYIVDGMRSDCFGVRGEDASGVNDVALISS
jgi:hypothetical protein